MALDIESLCVDLSGQKVLRNVSLQVPRGETIAIVGRNGAGKTTLLRSIMGLVPHRQGTLRLDGNDITQHPAFLRAALGFGYAPEERGIIPSLSVQQNMSFPCEVQRWSPHTLKQRLEFVLSIVPQLEVMLPRSGAALSGGQGKMVALGRALMVGNRYVLLDEPFQGLAPALARQYGDALRRLRDTQPDLCVLITESNASLLESVQSRTWYIERGSVAIA